MHPRLELDLSVFTERRDPMPFIMPWPQPGSPAAWFEFWTFSEWQAFLAERSLNPLIPRIVNDKFQRAQKLYLLTRADFDLVKAGELVALTALELALKDRYGMHFRPVSAPQWPADNNQPNGPSLQKLLNYLLEEGGLTNEKLPFTRKYGGTVEQALFKPAKKSEKGTQAEAAARHSIRTLADIRNSIAHGDPFDGLPWCGLLELVRDLIEFAYLDYLAEVGRTLRSPSAS